MLGTGGHGAWSCTVLQHRAAGFSFCLIAAQGFLLHRAISRSFQILKAAAEEMVTETMQPLPLAAWGCAPASHSPALSAPGAGLGSQCTSPVVPICLHMALCWAPTACPAAANPQHLLSPAPNSPELQQTTVRRSPSLCACPTWGSARPRGQLPGGGKLELCWGCGVGVLVCVQRMGHRDGAVPEQDALRGLQRGEAVRWDGATRRQMCCVSPTWSRARIQPGATPAR